MHEFESTTREIKGIGCVMRQEEEGVGSGISGLVGRGVKQKTLAP